MEASSLLAGHQTQADECPDYSNPHSMPAEVMLPLLAPVLTFCPNISVLDLIWIAGHAGLAARSSMGCSAGLQKVTNLSLIRGPGLPRNTELKPQAEAALTRLKQDVASKAAAARAAEQKTSATQALHKSAAGQLDSAQQELAKLQQEIAQGMRTVYNQVGITGMRQLISSDFIKFLQSCLHGLLSG